MMLKYFTSSGLIALALILVPQTCLAETNNIQNLANHTEVKPKFGTFGIATEHMDTSVSPGDDFYRYVNGTWLKTTIIPPDKTSQAISDILGEQATQHIRDIIQEAAEFENPTPDEKLIADLYKVFMGVEAIEAKGLSSLENDIERISEAESHKDIIRIMADKSLDLSSVVSTTISIDTKNPKTYILHVQQSGWGLSNFDDYFNKRKKAKINRKAYKTYLKTMLSEAGFKNSKTRAERVFKFEKKLAENATTAQDARDPDFVYNKINREELTALAPGLHFGVMFETSGLKDVSDVIVEDIPALQHTAQVFADAQIDVLKDYHLVKLLSAHRHILPRRFNDASHDFFVKSLRGAEQKRPRWKRAVSLVNGRLGELIGKSYVRKHFPESSKKIMEGMIENLQFTFKERIEAAEWMGDKTKTQALYKLTKMNAKIGYPENWETYEGLVINKHNAIDTFKSIRAWNWEKSLKKLSQPVDKKEWLTPPQTVNAYYVPPFNEILFPAAFLDAPYFDPLADSAVNYGAIGAVIGHEMGHGFDDEGRKFDGDGVQRDWWNEEDAKAFEVRADKLVNQYSQYEPLPGQFLNGRLSLGENIGDLTGITMAYYAYKKSLKGQEAPIIDGFTGDQRFFMAWAQAFSRKWREKRLSEQISYGKHSPDEFRVNGVLRNFQPWYDAFNVTPNHALYLAPKDRVMIW